MTFSLTGFTIRYSRTPAASNLFVFPVIKQRREQDDKTGSGIVNQGAGCGSQDSQNGHGHGRKVNAHGDRDGSLDGLYGRVGEPFEVRKSGNVIGHERHIGCLDGDVASHRVPDPPLFPCIISPASAGAECSSETGL